MSTTTTKRPTASQSEATKRSKKLESELKSLKKEVESLDSNTKTTARDVASVTKSLKNAKQIAKAAKSANAKVTDADMNRLSQSLEREKQLSKIVDKMDGTFTKRDVNSIERSLQYGKELAKLSRSLSGKIGAKEIRTLNKALVDAREVKRITKSLSGKSAAGMAKPLKRVADNIGGGDAGISDTLTGILESVSAIPKMADDIAALSKSLQSKTTKEKSSEFKTLEEKNELENKPKERAIVSRMNAESGSAELSVLSLITGALGIAGFGTSMYQSLSETARNTVNDAVKYMMEALKKEFTESIDTFKGKATEAISNPTAENIAEVGKSAREDLKLTPGVTTGAYAGEKAAQWTLGKIPIVGKYLAKIPGAGIVSKSLAMASRAAAATTALSDEEQKRLGADTKASAFVGSLFAGSEDDWWVTRAIEGLIAGTTAGAAIGGVATPGGGTLAKIRGTTVGAFTGGALGLSAGIVGPKSAVANIDTAVDVTSTVGKMAKELGYNPVANLYYGYHLENLKSGLERAKKNAKMSMTSSGQLEYSPADQLNIANFEREIENAERGLSETDFASSVLRSADLAKKSEEYSKRKWDFANGVTPSASSAPAKANPTSANVPSGDSRSDYYKNMHGAILKHATLAGLSNPDAIAHLGASQSSLETRFGEHLAGGNNYFGIKGKGKTLSTTEYVNGQYMTVNDSFRQYASMDDSAADYVSLLKRSGRYSAVIAAQTPQEAMLEQGRSGYATDNLYYNKIHGIYSQMGNGVSGGNMIDFSSNKSPANKEVFEAPTNGQTIVISNSFNNTQVAQESSPQPRLPEIPEQITIEMAPPH